MEQYEALPEDSRAEVLDGQIYYMASPSQDHQTISMELSTMLPLPSFSLIDKPDVKRCNGAPDFIKEIVSSGNLFDDYIRTLYYLKNAKAREYWVNIGL